MRDFLASRRPSPAMAVAFVALLAALSGTAVALPGTNSVDSGDIKNGQVKGKDIRNNAVTGKKVKNGAVKSADVGDNSLTGTDIDESTLGQVPSANTANSAGTAGSAANAQNAQNADNLDGADSTAYTTQSATAERTANLALSIGDQTVVSTTISVPAARVITVTASLDVRADGGNNDNVNCNTQIEGTQGVRQSQQIMDNTLDDVASFAMTQQLAVGAGDHTVLLECNEGGTANSTVDDAALTAIATG